MTKITPVLVLALVLEVAVAAGIQSPPDSDRPFGAVHGAVVPVSSAANDDLVQRYCVRCHNERRFLGNLTLEEFDPANPTANAPVQEGADPTANARRREDDPQAQGGDDAASGCQSSA